MMEAAALSLSTSESEELPALPTHPLPPSRSNVGLVPEAVVALRVIFTAGLHAEKVLLVMDPRLQTHTG